MPNDDEVLASFQDIDRQWSAILIGNGASRAISDKFAYHSLYETAVSDQVQHPLAGHEQGIFDVFQTRNFEQVLSALDTANIVNKAFKNYSTEIADSYDRIRTALVESVHAVHIPAAEV